MLRDYIISVLGNIAQGTVFRDTLPRANIRHKLNIDFRVLVDDLEGNAPLLSLGMVFVDTLPWECIDS